MKNVIVILGVLMLTSCLSEETKQVIEEREQARDNAIEVESVIYKTSSLNSEVEVFYLDGHKVLLWNNGYGSDMELIEDDLDTTYYEHSCGESPMDLQPGDPGYDEFMDDWSQDNPNVPYGEMNAVTQEFIDSINKEVSYGMQGIEDDERRPFTEK